MFGEMNLQTRGAPVLHEVAEPVKPGEDVEPLLTRMWEVMIKERGIGLAANQVGVLKRVIIVSIPGGFCQELINPVITKRSGGKVRSVEGCLSYPGAKISMMRDKSIVVEGTDRDGKRVRRKCRGLEAYCVQHEIDHLNGRTIE